MEDSLELSLQEFQREYSVEGCIGRGKFGEVEKVIHLPTKRPYAIKRLHCAKYEYARQAIQEIQILRECEHPRVVKLHRYYCKMYTRDSHRGYCAYGLIMELGVCSLQQRLHQHPPAYSLADVILLLRQLIEVGAYLEQKKYVHRDIKPDNIVMFGTSLDFKLADFGLSCHVHHRPKGFAGTLHYSSPKLVDYYHSYRKSRAPPPLPSNPFKDDVYSVAITVSEVLETIGYNWRSFKRHDSNSQLNLVLDEMLENDEWQRPTFLQLMQTKFMQEGLPNVEKTPEEGAEENPFKNITLREVERERDIPQQTIRKVNQFELQAQNTFTQKYTLKEPEFFDVPFRPRCITKISKRYILCGCQNGSLIIFDLVSGQYFTLTLKHRGYVVKVALDSKGDIWTAGGDGMVQFMELRTLEHCIQNNKRSRQDKSKNIYGVGHVQKYVDIYMDPESYKTVHHIPTKKHITELLCVDRDHFAVGYADGCVFVRWNGRESQYQNSFQVVTTLKVVDFQLYAASFNGNVTSYNLKTFTKDNFFYKFKDTVVDLRVTHTEYGLTMEAVTCSGCIQKIEVQRKKTFSFYEQISANNILGACNYESQWVTISASGILLMGNTELARCPLARGWSYLQICQNYLVGCSIEGQFLLAQLDRP